MAAITFSPLQNLKWLLIKNNYTEHLTEVVFGKFIFGNKVFYFKTALILRKKASNEGYKMSYDTENHCGYLISLELAKSPFCEVHLCPRPG